MLQVTQCDKIMVKSGPDVPGSKHAKANISSLFSVVSVYKEWCPVTQEVNSYMRLLTVTEIYGSRSREI